MTGAAAIGRPRLAQAGVGIAALACAGVLAACGGGSAEQASPSPGDSVDVSPSAEATETTGGAPLTPVSRPEKTAGPTSAEAQQLVDALDAAGLHARDATADARRGEAATLSGTEFDPQKCIAFADPGSPDAAAGAGPRAAAAAMGESGATADIEGEAGGAEVTIRTAFAVSGEVLVTATTVTAGGFSSSADPVEEIVAKALAEIG